MVKHIVTHKQYIFELINFQLIQFLRFLKLFALNIGINFFEAGSLEFDFGPYILFYFFINRREPHFTR